jgi:glycosyltransferase involved in cell wall biosynthesis
MVSERPKVSIITPTRDRPKWLLACSYCVLQQRDVDYEWLVLDGSKTRPSDIVDALCDAHGEKLRYVYSPQKLSDRNIGSRRNALCEMANYELIVHFDDDDYYASDYVSNAIALLGRYDMVKPLSFYTAKLKERVLLWTDLDEHRDPFAYGFALAYKKEVWNKVKFRMLSWMEENFFISDALRKGFKLNLYGDPSKCLHVLHGRNTAGLSKGKMLPFDLIKNMFADAEQWLGRSDPGFSFSPN